MRVCFRTLFNRQLSDEVPTTVTENAHNCAGWYCISYEEVSENPLWRVDVGFRHSPLDPLRQAFHSLRAATRFHAEPRGPLT